MNIKKFKLEQTYQWMIWQNNCEREKLTKAATRQT